MRTASGANRTMALSVRRPNRWAGIASVVTNAKAAARGDHARMGPELVCHRFAADAERFLQCSGGTSIHVRSSRKVRADGYPTAARRSDRIRFENSMAL